MLFLRARRYSRGAGAGVCSEQEGRATRVDGEVALGCADEREKGMEEFDQYACGCGEKRSILRAVPFQQASCTSHVARRASESRPDARKASPLRIRSRSTEVTGLRIGDLTRKAALPLLPLPPRARQDDASGQGKTKTSGPGESILVRARGPPTRQCQWTPRSTTSGMSSSHRGPDDTNRGDERWKVPAAIERYLDVLVPAPSCISPSSGDQTDHSPPHAPEIALSIDEFI
ncbi:hypothetical protein K438DRAFT_1954139 [Mycena galopus ATCC 62051]|nr:hypothetical protein K438DRAFT_1954139 [Mycena galopus ATCC 62051]